MDSERRAQRREWLAGGDPGAGASLLAARERAGELPRARIELLAYLGYGPARALLDLEAGDMGLPREAFRAGTLPLAGLPSGAGAERLEDPRRVIVRWEVPYVRLEVAEQFEGALLELRAFGALVLGLDCGAVRYASSRAVGQLAHTAHALALRGGRLFLLAPEPRIAQLVRVLGLIGEAGLQLGSEADLRRYPIGSGRSPLTPWPGAMTSPARRATQDWLLGLLRWGRRVFVRAAVEAARWELRDGLGDVAWGSQRRRALRCAEDWLREPGERTRSAAERAGERDAGWAGLAAASAASPGRCAWEPPPLPTSRARLAEGLAAWALGSS